MVLLLGLSVCLEKYFIKHNHNFCEVVNEDENQI